MASIVTPNFNYTYAGNLNTDFLYRPTIGVPDLSSLFTIRQGIKYKEQLHIVQSVSKIVKKYDQCARTFTSNTQITNRTIEVTDLEFNLEQCVDDFEQTVLLELERLGIERNNVLGTDIERAINQIVVDSATRDNFRILSWGDTADANADYNQLDGLYTRLVAGTTEIDPIPAASPDFYCVKKQETISTLDQSSGTRAIDYLRNLYGGAKNVLKQIPATQKVFMVTPNIWENYLAYLQNTGGSGTDGGFMMIQDGAFELFFNGIKVVPIYAWAEDLADTDNPYNGVINTLAIYTTPSNHVIGTPRLSDTTAIGAWYERKDRKVYFEGQYGLGYNYVHCDLTVFSDGLV